MKRNNDELLELIRTHVEVIKTLLKRGYVIDAYQEADNTIKLIDERIKGNGKRICE